MAKHPNPLRTPKGEGVTMLQGRKPKMGVTMLNTSTPVTMVNQDKIIGRTPGRKVQLDKELKKRGL